MFSQLGNGTVKTLVHTKQEALKLK